MEKRNDVKSNGELGALIRSLRRICGLTQMGLARKIGVSYQQVQKYEHGASELTMTRLGQIAGALDVPVGTFIPEVAGQVLKNIPVSEEDLDILALLRKLEKRGLKPTAIKILETITNIGN